MSFAKLVVFLAFIAFIGLIGWGFLTGEPIDLDAFTKDPWVIVGLGDLYIGFLLFAVLIFIVEPNKLVALLWVIPLFILGNGISALWLLINIDKFRARFARNAF